MRVFGFHACQCLSARVHAGLSGALGNNVVGFLLPPVFYFLLQRKRGYWNDYAMLIGRAPVTVTMASEAAALADVENGNVPHRNYGSFAGDNSYVSLTALSGLPEMDGLVEQSPEPSTVILAWGSWRLRARKALELCACATTFLFGMFMLFVSTRGYVNALLAQQCGH